MAQCACGCGRKIPFGRKRIANQMYEMCERNLAMAQGAVTRLPEFKDDAELKAAIAEGDRLMPRFRDYVHGDIERDDFDRDELADWNKKLLDGQKEMIEATFDYAGMNAHKNARIVLTGARAPATVTAVKDTGQTINDDPRVDLILTVEPPGGAPFEAKVRKTVSRVAIPQPGAKFEVAYDPENSEDLTYLETDLQAGLAASGDAPDAPSTSEEIANLAELHNNGALTDAEFSAAKAKLLG